jgi:TRAP-type C4-dicarboxylate transport system permease small subunit
MVGLEFVHIFLAVCALLVFGLLVWLAFTIIQQERRRARSEQSLRSLDRVEGTQ